MDSVGEGEGGKIWENGIETCEMSCMKRDASPGSKKKKKAVVILWLIKIYTNCIYIYTPTLWVRADNDTKCLHHLLIYVGKN